MSVMRHVAGLFDRYAVHRPDLIRAWADDDKRRRRPGRSRWQAAMWRQLRALIGTPSPAEALASACARIEADPARTRPAQAPRAVRPDAAAGVPPRVLRAIAATRDVHLYLLHPSPSLWER